MKNRKIENSELDMKENNQNSLTATDNISCEHMQMKLFESLHDLKFYV